LHGRGMLNLVNDPRVRDQAENVCG